MLTRIFAFFVKSRRDRKLSSVSEKMVWAVLVEMLGIASKKAYSDPSKAIEMIHECDKVLLKGVKTRPKIINSYHLIYDFEQKSKNNF